MSLLRNYDTLTFDFYDQVDQLVLQEQERMLGETLEKVGLLACTRVDEGSYLRDMRQKNCPRCGVAIHHSRHQEPFIQKYGLVPHCNACAQVLMEDAPLEHQVQFDLYAERVGRLIQAFMQREPVRLFTDHIQQLRQASRRLPPEENPHVPHR